MRDTEVIRRRLWAQIGLPLATATLLSACGSPNQPQPVKQLRKADDKGDKAKTDDKAAPTQRLDTNAASEAYVPPARYDDIPEGEFDYFGAPRDPFGEHDEEEGCPAGDWCGSPADARLFAVEHIPDQLGCPSKIIAKPETTNALKKTEKRWEGLSFHPMMQGRLMTSVTKERREQGDAEICCYHWFEYCSGRPLLDGETMIVAPLRPGSSWSCDPAEVAAPSDRPDSAIDPQLRARLGELWVEDARMEHASIAAFERATLELMAMAAPPELLAEIQLAAADEVVHAQRCFGLAARFSGQPREPGPLSSLEPRVVGLAAEAGPEQAGADWVRLALDTFVEGCVGETIATLTARRALRRCEDPASRATLELIVDDEGRHAGLAWQTIRWILTSCGEHEAAVIAALEQQAQAMAAEASSGELPEADPQAEELARFGRCDRRTELLARRDAWAELILPTLAAITRSGTDEADERPELWT
ncbi:MAG: ferritin-like domain-containing protein [Enhygromyxa sp.]